MARRKRYEEESENHERWLVSYADFITLLFAFFVVMYALSSVNEGKYKILSNSLFNAFTGVSDGPVPKVNLQPSAPAVPRPVPQNSAAQRRDAEALRRERLELTDVARDIKKVLAPLVKQGKVRVTQTKRGVSVEINASVLFAPGDANLTDETDEALRAIAAVLKNDVHDIQVEGHTDSVPIRNALFPSNWELSAVRASSVVRLFIESGIAETRLTAIGHGPTLPVDSNATPEGRMRNRRVEITVLSKLPEVATEVPVGNVSGGK